MREHRVFVTTHWANWGSIRSPRIRRSWCSPTQDHASTNVYELGDANMRTLRWTMQGWSTDLRQVALSPERAPTRAKALEP